MHLSICILCDKGVPLIFSFQVSMMLTFFSRGHWWDIAGRRGSPARRVSGWGVVSPGGICSSHGFILLWFCSLNLVKTFLQPSWPPKPQPPWWPMHCRIPALTSSWASNTYSHHQLLSTFSSTFSLSSNFRLALPSLVGQTTSLRRSEPAPNLPFLGDTPSVLEFPFIVFFKNHH